VALHILSAFQSTPMVTRHVQSAQGKHPSHSSSWTRHIYRSRQHVFSSLIANSSSFKLPFYIISKHTNIAFDMHFQAITLLGLTALATARVSGRKGMKSMSDNEVTLNVVRSENADMENLPRQRRPDRKVQSHRVPPRQKRCRHDRVLGARDVRSQDLLDHVGRPQQARHRRPGQTDFCSSRQLGPWHRDILGR
jgi:hypothetical protein